MNSQYQNEYQFPDCDYPKVSIIIPALNCEGPIALTLESVLNQQYPDYEVIIIDAGSTDRTLEVIKGFHSDKIRLYSVSNYMRYEMLNNGISHAQGTYTTILFPGDFYIYHRTLKYMMNLALRNSAPELVYCGTLLRDGQSEVKPLYRTLSLKLLSLGQQPTSLQSCWFRTDAIKQLGKFNVNYKLRGGFDLLFRFVLKGFRAMSSSRVLTDYDMRWVNWKLVCVHFMETGKTIWRYRGLLATVRWFFHQKDLKRIFKLGVRRFRAAFREK